MKKIIGIIGPIAAGKNTAAEYIRGKNNIPIFEISRLIKEVATSRGIDPTRKNLIDIGRKITLEKGAAHLAEKILSRVVDTAIIIGMRQLAQIQYLKTHSNFLLIAIDASPEIRFARAKARGKLGESETLEQFIDDERTENSNSVQRLFDCMKLADHMVINMHGLVDFKKSLDAILKDSGFLYKAPIENK